MRVRVEYSAQIKSAAGCHREELEVAAGTTAEQLIARLAERHGEPLRGFLFDDSGRLRPTVLVFVGDEQVVWGDARPLTDGVEVGLLSAIAGGSGESLPASQRCDRVRGRPGGA